MFSHLVNPKNKITVHQPLRDRDGDQVDSFSIGSGYGIFHEMTNEEIKAHGAGKYAAIGIIVYYSPDVSTDTTTVNGVEVVKSRSYPLIGDYVMYAGERYDLSGVSPKRDIHGKFIGYKVFCANV